MFSTKITNYCRTNLFIIFIITLLVACGQDPVDNGNDNTDTDSPENSDGYEDIKVVDGKVRFYISEKENSTRTASGLSARNWATSTVVVNGKSYPVEFTDEQTPRPYIEVMESNNYNAVLQTPSSSMWFGSSAYSNVNLPHSQIHHMESAYIRPFPMYANYDKATGNKLIFNDGFAMVVVKLKGSDKIASIKVENPTGKKIAGTSQITPSKLYFSVVKGVNYAVLNTTNKGEFVQLNPSSATSFRLLIAPGNYPEGLNISICDSQYGAMFVTTPALELSAGEIFTLEKEYECESDLVYYEGFDNFVWGGDVLKGESGYGFAPMAEQMAIDSGAALTLNGYEIAKHEVPYNYPGSAFIQSNSWNVVSGKSVGESHQMSESYVASRNIAGLGYMFRVQEHPGYIAIGSATQDRGIIQTTLFDRFKTISKAKLTIDMALQAGFNGELLLQLINGGVFESATLNGKPIELTTDNLYYRYETASCKLFKDALVIPSSQTEPQEWNRLEFIVNGVTDGTKLYLTDNISANGVHGIYLDRIEVREIEEWGKKDGTVRVLLWNILAGMWCDQHNNYDNFVEWVKKYDPDICIWTESETIYTDDPNPETISDNSKKFLPYGWAELGARFGQPYAAVGGDRDNYPQTVTSKFPITTVQRITDTDDEGLYGKKFVLHGAGHYQINLSGKTLNIVTCHMHPMTYAPSTPSAGQAASTAAHEGDYFREYEMKYIVKKTVNHSSYAGEQYWLLAGDTNSHSPLDAWYYGYAEDAPELLTHNVIRKNTNLKDVIGERYPSSYFMETYPTHNRIDFVYLSPSMFNQVDNAIVLIDEWCRPRKNGNSKNWYAPADHRPVLVDFVIK